MIGHAYQNERYCYRSFEGWERDELIKNLVGALGQCDRGIQERMVWHLSQCDRDYGRRVGEGLGVDPERVSAPAGMKAPAGAKGAPALAGAKGASAGAEGRGTGRLGAGVNRQLRSGRHGVLTRGAARRPEARTPRDERSSAARGARRLRTRDRERQAAHCAARTRGARRGVHVEKSQAGLGLVQPRARRGPLAHPLLDAATLPYLALGLHLLGLAWVVFS